MRKKPKTQKYEIRFVVREDSYPELYEMLNTGGPLVTTRIREALSYLVKTGVLTTDGLSVPSMTRLAAMPTEVAATASSSLPTVVTAPVEATKAETTPPEKPQESVATVEGSSVTDSSAPADPPPPKRPMSTLMRTALNSAM